MESKFNVGRDNRSEVVRWLAMAIVDRESANISFVIEQYGKSVYELQQCAEKLLKAFLLLNNCPIKKTHDIPFLMLEAVSIVPTIHTLRHIGVGAEEMAKFATCYRYPSSNGVDFSSEQEAQGATEFVTALYEYLGPLFGKAIIDDSLSYARVQSNPFHSDSIKDVIDFMLARHQSSGGSRPKG